MIIIATEFIPLSPLSIISMMVTWESSKWLGKDIVQSTGKKICESMDWCTDRRKITEIVWKTTLFTVQTNTSTCGRRRRDRGYMHEPCFVKRGALFFCKKISIQVSLR